MKYERAASALAEAERFCAPILPLREYLLPTDDAGAYEVQSINVRRRLANGARVVGRKIGLTSEAVQRQLGVSQPDFGVLFEDMALRSGDTLLAHRLIQPKIEAEIALVLSRDLNSVNVTAADVAAATDHAVAALEVVDSRIAEWKITFADTVADNGSSAFFVLGTERKSLGQCDGIACVMPMWVNGAVASLGRGAACLGNPLEAAVWLARTLAARGEWLREGDVVLTGALGPMVALKGGDAVTATIEGLGSVSLDLGVPA